MFKCLCWPKVVGTLGLSLGCISLGSQVVQAASFQGLGDLPGGNFSSRASGVSGDGSTVVGTSDIGGNNEAFRWTQEAGMVGLGNDSIGVNINTQAFGVSQDGSVIVGSVVNFDDGVHQAVFRWTELDGFVEIGGNFTRTAHDVSADGSVIVGVGSPANNVGEAFRWTQETGILRLGDLTGGNSTSFAFGVSDDGSVIVGRSGATNGNGNEAFRWTQETGMVGLGYIPGGELSPQVRSSAEDASSDGSVIVGSSSSPDSDPGGFEAFRWTQETGMVGLGILSASTSLAEAVSADGSVIVGRSNGAFIWDESNGMRNLQQVLTNEFGLDLTGWQLTNATGVSDDGKTIVGEATNPSGRPEGWIARLDSTSVPEPSSVLGLFLITGLGVLATKHQN